MFKCVNRHKLTEQSIIKRKDEPILVCLLGNNAFKKESIEAAFCTAYFKSNRVALVERNSSFILDVISSVC